MYNTGIDYLPIVMQVVFAAGFVAFTLFVSHYLGPKRHSRVKDANFECGVRQYGNARIPFSVKYFIVAILFVLFDVEVIFMYPWAVNFRALGIEALWKMLLFMGLLLAGFYYVIKRGALEWE
jgi:NADH-quinone oxidoreductase subunit A